jgi:hypothetical protein
MEGPYGQMRAWLLPLVVAAACVGGAQDKPTDTGDPPVTSEGTGCLGVPLETQACPPSAQVQAGELMGSCGSTITSIDGEGSFGSDPSGWGDSSVLWCCYPVHETESTCDYGRPYVSSGRALVSGVERGAGWCGEVPGALELPEEARALLQSAWEQSAQDEHAAVAAFSRIALELLAFGAPAELVDATLAAAREEVAHARLGFALASRYAGQLRTASAFPLEPSVPRAPDLATFAAATAREGCVGETVTVLVTTECLARTTDPAVRAALSQIVADERGHAALAWRTVRWALSVGGPEVRAAVAQVFADLASREMPLPERLARGPHRALLMAHGLPDEALARRGIDRAVAEVVLPTARALLAPADQPVAVSGSL